ncbi:MAG: hypothetical protein KF858_10125 [Candidatus Sumerlaeia bacterium]|nr:hypothetical protein [Candidatus Sumerlaeia bacterium]
MKADRRKRLLLAAAAICFGLFALDKLVLGPLGALWTEQARRIGTTGEALDRGTMLLDRRDSLAERWTSMKRESLPASTSEAETMVLDAIGRWSSASGLNVTGVRPRWLRTDPVGDRFEVRLSAEGSINAVSRFLYALESDAIPIRVEETEIRSRADDGSVLTLSVRFSALRIQEARS